MKSKLLQISNSNLENVKYPSNYSSRNITKATGNIVLIGMRRLGKTQFLNYSFMNSGLSKDIALFIDMDDPLIDFIDFDKKGGTRQEFIDSLIDIISFNGIELVMIDEIQKIDDWSRLLKGLVDKFPNVRFIATGSDAIKLKNGTDYGVGRFSIHYMGAITIDEFAEIDQFDFDKYIDYGSFPERELINLNDKYATVVEKQINVSNSRLVNIKQLLRSIAMNPGNKTSLYALTKRLKDDFNSSIDGAQVKKIIQFLIDSQLIISVPDIGSQQKFTKGVNYTLYPTDWNLYQHYSRSIKYSDHPSKIDYDSKDKNLPTKGFIFENMIISNVYSKASTERDRNFIFNKVSHPDIDIIIDNTKYEIKSFDVLEADIETKARTINKSIEINTTIIHTGETTILKGVNLINYIEFIRELNFHN